jgi:uncharacterized membrane protein YqaE (UPF0057 family)
MEIAVTIILKSKFGFCHNIIFSLGIFNNIIVCLVRVDMVLTCLSYLPGAITCAYHILYDVTTLLLTCLSYLPAAFTCVYHILYHVTTLLLTGSYLPRLLPICHICCLFATSAALRLTHFLLFTLSLLVYCHLLLFTLSLLLFKFFEYYVRTTGIHKANHNSQSQPCHSKHTGRNFENLNFSMICVLCKFELRNDLCGCACLLTGLFCMIILYCSLVCFLSIDDV